MREFLASEAMAALRVPTTRCLCVVATGDGVVRQWYGDDGRERVLNEPGAVGTRVARSYLRFGQMELFTQRGDLPLLQALCLPWPYLPWPYLPWPYLPWLDNTAREQSSSSPGLHQVRTHHAGLPTSG